MKQIHQRLTYANVMSSIAVFMVLGGATAFAATKIGANELKANSVLTGKIKKEAVTAGKIKNGAIINSKIADKAVTGPKIDVTTLGTVPNATNALHAKTADSATTATSAATAGTAGTAGTANTVKQITGFAYEADNGNSETVVLNDFQGLTLRASCESGNNKGLTVKASSSVANATISFTSSWQAEDTANNAYSQLNATPLVIYSPTGTTKTTNGAVGIGFSAGQIVYSQPKGSTRVSVNWAYNTGVAGNDCYWAGTVVGTA